jgi:drug/metabolite transporter (DMT)-like permease
MRAKDWLVFIILGILWGSSFLWIKIAIQEISPLLLVTLRLSFAIITLTIAAIIARPLWPQGKRLWLTLVLFGLINTAIPYFLISWGEQYIDSAVAAILNSSTPLFAMIIAHIFLDDDRITLPRLTGLLIGFVGIVIIVSRDLGQNESVSQYATLILLGQAAVLLASLLYAGSAVFAKRNLKGLSPVVQGLVPIVGASTFLWLLIPIVEDPLSLPELPITWIAIAWLGLLGTGFAFILYFYLIQSVGPTRTTLVTYIFPLVGLVLGVIVLGETLDWRLAVGAALIIISVVVVNQSS